MSDGKYRIETVPVLWRFCQNPEAQVQDAKMWNSRNEMIGG